MKKMTHLLLTAGFILAAQLFVNAQPGKIARQHAGSVTTFSDLTLALAASVSGDTLYLPGGSIYASSTVTIDKSLTIIGAGHYPDSTAATYQTIIPSIVNIVTGADGGGLFGIKFGGTVQFGTSTANQNVNNFRIVRCYIPFFYPYFAAGTGVTASQNILISENVILYMGLGGFLSAVFEKNIMTLGNSMSGYYYSGPATFNNDIFIGNLSLFIGGSGPCTINNCIYINTASSTSYSIGTTTTIFNNFLLTYTNPAAVSSPVTYNGTWNNTLTRELSSDTFLNNATTTFAYTNNYHLKPTSNGHNAGSDGTDVGLYGTQIPYKESAVPFNPHISSKSIGNATNSAGSLNVDIKVSAQDR